MKKVFAIVALVFALTISASVSAQSNISPETLRVGSSLCVTDFAHMSSEAKILLARRGQVMTGVVVNCREWITLRAEPSVYGASLAHIPLGAQILVSDVPPVNGFYTVTYNGINGFALTEYIRITGAG